MSKLEQSRETVQDWLLKEEQEKKKRNFELWKGMWNKISKILDEVLKDISPKKLKRYGASEKSARILKRWSPLVNWKKGKYYPRIKLPKISIHERHGRGDQESPTSGQGKNHDWREPNWKRGWCLGTLWSPFTIGNVLRGLANKANQKEINKASIRRRW